MIALMKSPNKVRSAASVITIGGAGSLNWGRHIMVDTMLNPDLAGAVTASGATTPRIPNWMASSKWAAIPPGPAVQCRPCGSGNSPISHDQTPL